MSRPSEHEAKRAALIDRLRALESVAVAFSGGVDSGVLLHAAREALGDRAAAVIADSPSLPRRELEEARVFAASIGARLEVARTDELSDPSYRANAGDRCYFCKTALFSAMEPWARAKGFRALAFGAITDDALDDRPGARAAREFRVVAPLAEAGLGKDDVRRYAAEAGLEIADKPASACLASRIPVGTEVTRERLAAVEDAEEALRELGLAVLRVRHHGDRARVELGAEEHARLPELEHDLRARLAARGFAAVDFARYLAPAERTAGGSSH